MSNIIAFVVDSNISTPARRKSKTSTVNKSQPTKVAGVSKLENTRANKPIAGGAERKKSFAMVLKYRFGLGRKCVVVSNHIEMSTLTKAVL